MGGEKAEEQVSNSVLLLNVNETDKKWREGPRLNEKRDKFASVVCNGTLFVIGGCGDNDDDLDTVESIQVGDLLHAPGANSTTSRWKTLDCRLSTKRSGCAAAAVQDRFIVVVGGYDDNANLSLSSVDIIDTASKSRCAVVSGPSLNIGRWCFGMAVIGQRIYVVGGELSREKLPVEYMEFEDCSNHADVTVTSVFPSTKSWKIQEELALDTDRCQHCVVKMGSCLVVAGGLNRDDEGLSSVEVMDTEQRVMWKLPSMTTERNHGSMVVISNGILAISSYEEDTCEYLALTEKKEQNKVRTMNKKEDKVLPLLNRVDQIEKWKAGATNSLEQLFELNKKLVEENKMLVEENKRQVETNKRQVETNKRQVEENKRQVETNKRLESRLHKLEQLIVGDEK